MANQDLSDLTATTTPADADIAYVVVDPAGTPLPRKVTIGDLRGDVQEFMRTTDLTISELNYVRVVEGTFTAKSTAYVFDISVGAQVLGPAIATLVLYVGHATAGGAGASLYDQSLTATNGGTSYFVGVLDAESLGGTASRAIRHTGFTIGQTVTFHVMLGILGGATQFKSNDAPNRVAVTPNGKKMFISKFGSASVQPWRLEPAGYNRVYDFGWNQQPGISIPVGIWPGNLVAGNFAGAVCNAISGSVSIFDTLNEVWLRDTISPSGSPNGVDMNRAETTLYTCTTSGLMFPITISTGAAGSTVAVGAGSDNLFDCCLNAAETKVYCANYTQNVVRGVTLPSTLGSTIATTGKPVRVRRSPSLTLTASTAASDIVNTAVPHGLAANDRVVFTSLTGGTGLTVGTSYHVIAANLTTTAFQVSATQGGSASNFTADITAGAVAQDKIWVLTEAGGPAGVAMLKSIDPNTDTVLQTHNLDYANANDFTIMSGGQVAFVVFDAGMFQQCNIDTVEFEGGRPAGHSGQLGYEDAGGVIQLYTGPVNGIGVDSLDSVYYTMLDVDQVYKHPGGEVRVWPASYLTNFASVVARSA